MRLSSFSFAPLLALAACADPPAPTTSTTTAIQAPAFARTRIAGDVYHYTITLPVGTTPNAALRIHRVVRERAPFQPRHAAHAAMLLHGDFATFASSFAPTGTDVPSGGLAPYLAAHDVDVWGVDRRWTLPATDGDTSDFASMGVAQETDDVRAALALARATRAAGGDGDAPLALIGFSHGAQLAYTYAALEGGRPARERQVNALVALDFYGTLGPDAEDARALFCGSADYEYGQLAIGSTDAPNDFFIGLGELARSAPDDPSPWYPPFTNRGAILATLGQTYQFAPFTPLYHLLAPTLAADGSATAFAMTSDVSADTWLASAPPHQAMREGAELDDLLCGTGSTRTPPVTAPLAAIRVPLLYVGATGGVGAYGVYTTTQVSSRDVTARVVTRAGANGVIDDVGHADLLFAADAPTLVWQPLAAWLARH